MRLKAIPVETCLLIIDLDTHETEAYGWDEDSVIRLASALNQNSEALQDAFDGDGDIFCTLCEQLGV